MSRKYTFPAASASPNPVANTASNTDVNTTSGSHGSTMFLANSSATESTVSSTANVNNPAMIVETIRCSRGKATLRTKAPLATTLSMAVLTDTLKNVHGSRPHSR